MLAINKIVEIDTVSSQIAQELERHAPVWFGSGAKFVRAAPTIRSNRNSLLLLYTFQDYQQNQRRIYTKIARRPRMKTLADAIANEEMRQRAQHEYGLLVDIDIAIKSFAPGDMCALRPLAYLAPWNAVVTEELPCRSLKSLMFAPSSLLHVQGTHQQLERVFSLAGSWLRIFHHEVGNYQLETYDDTYMLNESQRVIDGLIQHTSYDLRSVREIVQRRIRSLKGRVLPVALTHGDYGTFNVFVNSEGRVGALDASDTRRNTIYFDIGWFLSDLRTSKLQTISWGKIVTKPTIRAYEQAFLQGYFQNEEIDQELLILMSLHYILLKWLSHEEKFQRHTHKRELFVRPWIQRYFYHATLKLAAYLEAV